MSKGGWRGGGRPKGSKSKKETRDVVKQVRWTDSEWADVESMAEKAGLTPSEFIRVAALSHKD